MKAEEEASSVVIACHIWEHGKSSYTFATARTSESIVPLNKTRALMNSQPVRLVCAKLLCSNCNNSPSESTA